MIVVWPCGAGGCAPLIAELRPHGLQTPCWKRERRGQALRSGFRGHDRLDQSPRWAVGVGRVVKVEGVRRVGGVGPDRCRHFRGCAMGQCATAGRGNHEPIVRFIGVESPAGAVSAGTLNRIRLIRFRAARQVYRVPTAGTHRSHTNCWQSRNSELSVWNCRLRFALVPLT